MKLTKNTKWIDILPSVMFDWGYGHRVFIGWIYWTLEIKLTTN